MIVCGKCGEHNEDDATFCSSCGEFLEWAGKRVEEPVEAVAGEPVAAEPVAAESQHAQAVAETAVEESQAADRTVGTERPVAEPAAAVSPELGAEPEELEAAPAGPVGAPDGHPPGAEHDPAARLPGEEFARRSVSKPSVAPDRGRAGDLFCTNCGTGNAATARFCRHCGTPLAHVTVTRAPWWRRLFPKRQPLAAGERPGRRRSTGDLAGGTRRRAFAGLRQVVIALAVVAAAVAVLGPFRERLLQGPYEWAREQFVDPVEIHPPRASGPALSGHPPRDAIDTSNATFWAPPGAPRGKAITVRLDGKTDLRKVGFRLGSADDFTRFSRPRVVRVRFSDGGGRVVTQRFLRLRDTPDRQVFDLEGDDVTRVRVAIISVYPGQNRSQAAIAKIALWERG